MTMCWNVDVKGESPATNHTGIPFEHFSRALLSGKEAEIIEKEILLEDSRVFNDIVSIQCLYASQKIDL